MLNTTTTGLYRSPDAALNALHMLQESGVAREDISLVAKDDLHTDVKQEHLDSKQNSKAPSGFALGAAGGGTVGAVLAALGAVGGIATGGAGFGLLVAGPLATALIGAGTGAAAGSVIGGMIGAAMQDPDVKYYEEAIQQGSVLIGVNTTDDDSRASVTATLQAAGAERIA
jgi:hypothetical protein